MVVLVSNLMGRKEGSERYLALVSPGGFKGNFSWSLGGFFILWLVVSVGQVFFPLVNSRKIVFVFCVIHLKVEWGSIC